MGEKKPIVLRDPTKDYYPEGKKPEESKEVPSAKSVNFGLFGSQKKLGNKETDEEQKKEENKNQINNIKCSQESDIVQQCTKDKNETKVHA